MMKRQSVYLDHAATTPLAGKVLSVMRPYLEDKFGNPSSLHSRGHEASMALAKAREQVAGILGCRSQEIIFTASGTEADNLALKGAAEARNFQGHIITSAIEHPAVLESVRYLESRGMTATYIGVNPSGLVNPSEIVRAIRDNTFLVSLMYANNEIGTIQPIAEISNLIKKRKGDVVFHTDAVQAPGLLPLAVDKLHVDLLSLSAHKFYGPKGAGLLYARRGTKLSPQILGGGQERGFRSGTENVAAIVGLATALEAAEGAREKEASRLTKLRDWMISEIGEQIPQAVLTGHPSERLPNNVSFCFPGLEGEALVLRLSERGYECSSGSACSTGKTDPSHVLLALGLDKALAAGSLRITLGKDTRFHDLEQFVPILRAEVEKLSHF